jgi:GNAT superfamily N-acetyltransferase
MSSEPSVRVQRAVDADWHVLRALRLAALADSPEAFGSTLAAEASYQEDQWRHWTRTAGIFVAYRGTEPVGLAAGVDGAEPGERRVISAWVKPAHRSAGVGAAVIAAVVAWARAEGASTLSLWVTRANLSARRLYANRGFVASGRTKPLPSRPALTEDELVLRLR